MHVFCIEMGKPYYNRVNNDVSGVLGSGCVESVAVTDMVVTTPSQSVAGRRLTLLIV